MGKYSPPLQQTVLPASRGPLRCRGQARRSYETLRDDAAVVAGLEDLKLFADVCRCGVTVFVTSVPVKPSSLDALFQTCRHRGSAPK
jgi:hypothetical protein